MRFASIVRLHADLGGKILENRKEVAPCGSLQHVEAVIRLFDPAYDVRRITARRRYKGNGIFKRGTILRLALDVLRKAQGPLTAREVTERMMAIRGVTDIAAEPMRSLIASVQTSLQNHNGKTVTKTAEGMPGRWRLV
jgi:hypothetical protein